MRSIRVESPVPVVSVRVVQIEGLQPVQKTSTLFFLLLCRRPVNLFIILFFYFFLKTQMVQTFCKVGVDSEMIKKGTEIVRTAWTEINGKWTEIVRTVCTVRLMESGQR